MKEFADEVETAAREIEMTSLRLWVSLVLEQNGRHRSAAYRKVEAVLRQCSNELREFAIQLRSGARTDV